MADALSAPPAHSGEAAADQEVWWIHQTSGWWCAVDTDPALDPDASWEDYELFEQKIYVDHPLVFHNDLLKQDRPKCHKCNSKHGKALLIHGWRPGSHPVLTPDGQFCVLSFGLKCPSCPSHKNKDYFFSCSEPAFLQHNFHPAIFDLLPWQLLTARSGFNEALAADVRRRKADGSSFLEIANHRNQAVASRLLQRYKIYLGRYTAKQKALAAKAAFLQQPVPPEPAPAAAAAAAA
uniref:Uncharacterized protein n=1 Tax=Tetradesmus obliquus TaxID=3088 RepID=A0A383WL30_TETOB|eukprot:jgi/Sobl393_1/9762/SZX78121.1